MPTICDVVYNYSCIYSCIVVSGHVDRFWVDFWVWMSKSLWYFLLPPRVGSVVGETLKRRERELLKARNQSQKTFGVVSFIIIALQFWRSRTRTVDDDLGELW